MTNFDFPYIASSFREFWKRWHISLSSFLMEYLYIPLGGNRKGRLRTYVNLMITMILGGLWHGAAWSYAVWGAFHGAALAIERFLSGRADAHPVADSMFVVSIKRALVFVFVSLAWLLFKLPQFSDVVEYFNAMFRNASLSFDSTLCGYIFVYSCPVLFYHAWYLWRRQPSAVAVRMPAFAAYGTLLFLILVNAGSTDAFIYFQF